MMSLPPEILLLVAENLKEDRRSLYNFFLSEASSYNTLLPLLYKKVVLPKSVSLARFCRSIVTSPRALGRCVLDLSVGGNPRLDTYTYNHCYLPKRLIDQLRATFKLLPNLQRLFLGVRAVTFERCLSNLDVEFELQSLTVPFTNVWLYEEFLSRQPSITTLHLISPSLLNRQPKLNFTALHPTLLPKLSIVTASLDELEVILPGRPLSAVYVNDTIFSFETLLSIGTPDDFFFVGLDTLKTVSLPRYPAPHPGTTRLIILRGPKPTTKLQFIDDVVQDVHDPAFASPEHIEIIVRSKTHYGGNTLVTLLRDLQTIEAWNVYIPSLRSVMVYGINFNKY